MNIYDQKVHDKLSPCETILNHYTCPEDCGECCNAIISFRSTDLIDMLSKYSNMTEFIESKIVRNDISINDDILEVYEFTENPCPLRKNCRCSVYEGRPLVCRAYPFTFGRAPIEGYVTIDSCPLGLQVMRDITLFAMNLVIHSSSTNEKKDAMIDQYLAKLAEVSSDQVDFNVNDTGKCMYIPHVWLSHFETFLNRVDGNDLNEKRITLRDTIKNEYEIDVKW